MWVISRWIGGFHEGEPGKFEGGKSGDLPKINWFSGKQTQGT